MIAHKKRNKLTSIIFALSLGCIIFLLTAANLQVNGLTDRESKGGIDIFVSQAECKIYEDDKCFFFNHTDAALEKHESKIKSFGYTTNNAPIMINEDVLLRVSDPAMLVFREDCSVYGLSPSSAFDDSLRYKYLETKKTTLSATEQLYTARGSQGMGLYKDMVKDLGLDPSKGTDLSMLAFYNAGNNNYYQHFRGLYNADNRPHWGTGPNSKHFIHMSIPNIV